MRKLSYTPIILLLVPLLAAAAPSYRASSDTNEAVACMVAVLKTVPGAEEIDATLANERESDRSPIVTFVYRDNNNRQQQVRFLIQEKSEDGFYRFADPGLVLYDVYHVLADRCHVRGYVMLR